MFGGKGNSYYSGKYCHKYIDKLIERGRELYLISPYIDSYYAEFLVRHAKGKRIRIIGSSIDTEAQQILEGRKNWPSLFLPLASILFFNYISYSLHIYTVYLTAASICLLLAAVLLFRGRKHNIKIRIPREFTHVKLYISDEMAIHGSANLTYNGMHKNIEHIEVVHDNSKVDDLRREFWNIWNNS